MRLNTIPALTLAGLCLLSPIRANSAITIDFEIPDPTPTIGSSFSVNAVITGLGNGVAPSISLFDLIVNFDNTILGIDTTDSNADDVIDAVTLDPDGNLDLFQLGGNILESLLDAPGALTLLDTSFDDPGDLIDEQAGSFTLATMTFDAVALGTASFSFTLQDIADADGNAFAQTPTLTTGSVTVQDSASVPTPATVALLATGLVGLRFAGRRRAC